MDIEKRIVLACRELARTRGFYSLTMDKLANQAGLSKRTIYRYFRSKEEIIEATIDSFIQETEEKFIQLATKEDNVENVVSYMFDYILTQGQFIFNLQGLNDLRLHYPYLWQRIKKIREEKIQNLIRLMMEKSENKSAVQEIDSRILTAVIVASINKVMTPDFLLTNGLTLEETAKQFSKLLLALFSISLGNKDYKQNLVD
ncbi:MAG: TetR/AcrR family transcriptional regulator [Syntrophomonadaceae bacterium]|nr:TetR/AcrR family transcriptional regulator [Syntrophomonadaceae bacterium]